MVSTYLIGFIAIKVYNKILLHKNYKIISIILIILSTYLSYKLSNIISLMQLLDNIKTSDLIYSYFILMTFMVPIIIPFMCILSLLAFHHIILKNFKIYMNFFIKYSKISSDSIVIKFWCIYYLLYKITNSIAFNIYYEIFVGSLCMLIFTNVINLQLKMKNIDNIFANKLVVAKHIIKKFVKIGLYVILFVLLIELLFLIIP
jgi:hypothetical protein